MDRPRLVGADLVRCAACTNLVAIVRDGVVTVKHKGRTVVAINYNTDVGDAWEYADHPMYPAEMTALAYRYGVNYVIYAMTH